MHLEISDKLHVGMPEIWHSVKKTVTTLHKMPIFYIRFPAVSNHIDPGFNFMLMHTLGDCGSGLNICNPGVHSEGLSGVCNSSVWPDVVSFTVCVSEESVDRNYLFISHTQI